MRSRGWTFFLPTVARVPFVECGRSGAKKPHAFDRLWLVSLATARACTQNARRPCAGSTRRVAVAVVAALSVRAAVVFICKQCGGQRWRGQQLCLRNRRDNWRRPIKHCHQHRIVSAASSSSSLPPVVLTVCVHADVRYAWRRNPCCFLDTACGGQYYKNTIPEVMINAIVCS